MICMKPGRTVTGLIASTTIWVACTVPDLAAVGRPCSDDAPCGPGTSCSAPPRTCVPGTTPPDAGLDARPPDQGAPDQRIVDARGDIFVIVADAFTPPGLWKSISAGTFTMGSPPGETCRPGPDAGVEVPRETQHKVTLTRGFAISVTEVTGEQHMAIMGQTHLGHIYHPACTDNWHDAVAYCNELSAGVGLTPCYKNIGSSKLCKVTSDCPNGERCNPKHQVCQQFAAAVAYSGAKIYDCPGYRLPTEAEWEYAYRAGTTTPLYNGKSLTPKECHSCSVTPSDVEPIAWHCAKTSSVQIVGPPKLPNAWGLYNMAGNAHEWVHDPYQADLGSAAVIDPVGVASGPCRVLRGGSVDSFPASLRAAARTRVLESTTQASGVRCVRTVTP